MKDHMMGNKFTAMKFRVMDEKHSLAIQKELGDLGYTWCFPGNPTYSNMPYLFASEEGDITYCGPSDDAYFNRHCFTEFVLINGRFNPILASCPIELDSSKVLGLRSKIVVDSLRVQEILEAMLRYNKAGEPIPKDWLDELMQRT
jgi:hypothetical protein